MVFDQVGLIQVHASASLIYAYLQKTQNDFLVDSFSHCERIKRY